MDNKLKKLLNNIFEIIQQFQNNKILQYFEIGKAIFEHNQFTNKDKSLEELGIELDKKYPKSGYKRANLYSAERFYKAYKDHSEQFEQILQIDWTLIKTLLKIEDENIRSKFQEKILNEKWTNSRLSTEIKNLKKTQKNKEQSIDYSNFELNIEQIYIKNFKSIIEIKEKPNNFSVFVGTNGSGKSSIFEALEMLFNANRVDKIEIFTNFGEKDKIINYKAIENNIDNLKIKIDCGNNNSFYIEHKNNEFEKQWSENEIYNKQFLNLFSRVFIDNSRIIVNKLPIYDKITQNAGNLIKILNENIIPNENLFENFKTNLISLRPTIENVYVSINKSTKELELQIKEKDFDKPFNETQISDGTIKIIALLTVLFQTENPQFICIEEPENGLHPYLIKQFISLCKNLVNFKGDYIWLTTHSPVVVRELDINELIVVDFINGKTIIKPANKIETANGLKMDDAWLTNHLNGGLPW
jgi:AAA15 family ATPase/GTPase